MEIIVRIIQDLNRTLDLGLYVLMDSNRICLLSLSTGTLLIELPSNSTLDFYLSLVDLKNKITSWHNNFMCNKPHVVNNLAGQIYMSYKFDISKHFKLKKYGEF